MKGFFQSNNRIYCLTNIFVCVLCTGYLCTGYYNVNNDTHQEKDTVLVDTETDPLSGNTSDTKTQKSASATTTVVTAAKTSTSSKKYVRPNYDELTGSAVVDYAKKYIGLRYVSGGNSLTTGTDCSGFTKLIYQQFGISLSRTVKSQMNNGSYVSKGDLQKGDLIFYGQTSGVASHVAIYIGDGKVIHQSTPKSGVKISGMNMMVYITARRVITEKSELIEEDATGDTSNTDNKTEEKNEIYTENEYNENDVSNNTDNVQEETKQEVENNTDNVETYTNNEYGTSN